MGLSLKWANIVGVLCALSFLASSVQGEGHSASVSEEDQVLTQQLMSQLQEWYRAADENDPDAYFNLGQYYRTGIGIEPDLELAEFFYGKAAELGHLSAQKNLATLYYFAFPDSPRTQQAHDWWLRAAYLGDTEAQMRLAALYFKGPVLMDPIEGAAWVFVAASSGDMKARLTQDQLESNLSAEALVQVKERHAILQTQMKPMPPSSFEANPQGGMPEYPPMRLSIPVGGPRHYVQVAALAQREDAERMAQRIQTEHQDLLEQLRAYVMEFSSATGRVVYRVQIGSMDEARQAADLCRQFKQRRMDCFVGRD
ncbi:SPOR domain-containing protein [Nitrincola nitratireducens]|uniref:Polar organelle development protein n=1 Tax=Nitrincola nitratireducens TaxID=1229521 RepID=W9UZU3_9GAMM|nr:SPOR domain-containing protein [Nitrincola nitratireducens]EXJ09367.1 Polar organelle development protein [Nitrincola nitratireducens]